MDQKKIGVFLKELRKQKGLTQEQLAERFSVSGRTVSRWENGNNLPDLDILIEISDFYEVDLREILNGERKSGNMNKENNETVLKAVDYTNAENEKTNRRIRICNAIALLLIVFYMIAKDTTLYAGNSFMAAVADFAHGAGIGMLLVGLIASGRHGAKIRAFKQRLLHRSAK